MTRSIAMKWILWLVCCAALLSFVGGQTCGEIGTVDSGSFSAARGHGFYLNTQDAATCDGTIDSLEYCYDRTGQTFDIMSYEFTAAAYRNTGGTYQPVSGRAFRVMRTTSNSNSGFGCGDPFVVDPPLEVKIGDMIGVCIYNPPGTDRLQLDVVGSQGQFLMMTGTSGCGLNTVPTSVSSLTMIGSRSLHVWANISPLPTTEPPMTTTMGTPPPITTPPTTMGTTPSTTMPPTTMLTTVMVTTEALPTTASTDPPEPPTNEASTATVPTASTDANQTATPPPVVNPPPAQTDNTGGIVAAVVIVLILLVLAAVATTVVIVVVLKGRRKSEDIHVYEDSALQHIGITSEGIDNQLYTVEATFSADYQEIDSTPLSNEVASSANHYVFDNTYELPEGGEPLHAAVYAEVGPSLHAYAQLEDIYQYTSPLDAPVISYKKLLEKNQEEDIYGSENPYQTPATQEDAIYAQLKTWGVQYIHRSDIEITGHLGSGQFGSVEQGVWKRQGTKPVDVALKSLTKTSEEDKVKFLQEAAIMAQFRHPNVITLHGMAAHTNPVMIVVELAKKGDLRNFLLAMKPDPGEILPDKTRVTFLRFSQQVALGMQYLSAKGFVHRDLAARNVLITNNYLCKVADFGMSRDLADEDYYVSHGKDKIPVKWTAPEALHYKKYSTASDVWSYGCLLYEIWSVGHKPFEGIANIEALRIIDRGHRLTAPPGTPRTIYELMINCWNSVTSRRPTFRDIVLTLVGSEEMVLNIPEEDSSTNPLAGVLGAPLEAGENMYTELQRRYHVPTN